MRKIVFISLFIFLLLPFSLAYATSAQADDAGQKVPREAGIDEGMLYYWLRYGKIVPDSVAETLKFLGTGFAANPSNTENIVNAIAIQAIYGTPPAKGVSNYSTSMVDDMLNAGNITKEDARYYQSAGMASLATSTKPDQSSNDQKNKTDAEKGDIKEFSDFPAIVLGNANSARNDITLAGNAISRAKELREAVPASGDFMPEQAGSRDIGKNSTGSTGTGGNVYAEAFAGEKGQTTKPTSVQNALATLAQWMGTLATIANPDSTGTAVNTGVLPPPNGLTESQKSVTSTGTSGNGSFLGRGNEVAQNGAPPKTDLSDAIGLSERIQRDNIYNGNQRLQNINDHFGGGANDLQNQFGDQFNDMADNRFPSDGSGGSGSGPAQPATTPLTPASGVCNINKTTETTKQEAVDIADLIGLPIVANKDWEVSFYRPSDYPTDTQSFLPQGVNMNACVWIVCAQTECAYVADGSGRGNEAFLFDKPTR